MLKRLTIPMVSAFALAMVPATAVADEHAEKAPLPASEHQRDVLDIEKQKEPATPLEKYGEQFPATEHQRDVLTEEAEEEQEAELPASPHQENVLGVEGKEPATPAGRYGEQFPATEHQEDVLEHGQGE